jgi:Fe-S-cluster containining protein
MLTEEFGVTASNPEYFPILAQDIALLQVVDAAFADSARRSGKHLVCRPGCTQCCHGAFAIDALDALRLRVEMARLAKEEPARAEAIRARAGSYLNDFAGEFPGDAVTGILGESEEEQAAFEDFANEAACPALDPETGLCDVYRARPMTCRVFGPPIRSAEADEDGLAVCELCFTEATAEEIEAAEMRVPVQEEQELLEALRIVSSEKTGDTIVAYCLI